jgi:hypothetical protein
VVVGVEVERSQSVIHHPFEVGTTPLTRVVGRLFTGADGPLVEQSVAMHTQDRGDDLDPVGENPYSGVGVPGFTYQWTSRRELGDQELLHDDGSAGVTSGRRPFDEFGYVLRGAYTLPLPVLPRGCQRAIEAQLAVDYLLPKYDGRLRDNDNMLRRLWHLAARQETIKDAHVCSYCAHR